MAREPMLALPAPSPDSPRDPVAYGSPAILLRKQARRVSELSSCERLAQMQVRTEEAHGEEEGEEEVECGQPGRMVQTSKKSWFWSREVEERLGLGGADPYGLLELDERRWLASHDELRRAYRRLVLTHHPDKRAAMKTDSPPAKRGAARGDDDEAAVDDGDDGDFKLLTAAWELLGNAEERRKFDSVDYFNDHLPHDFLPRPGDEGRFYRVFRGPFARQAKFSVAQPVPALGDDETPIEEVNAFYRFWQNFRSWRDFGLLAEHDLSQADDREERRWMVRQNKNIAAKYKRDETARVQSVVELAYKHDPRVIRAREAREAAREAQRAAREATLRAEREAAASAARAAEAAEAAEAAAERRARSDERAASKREKERARSALKRARKELRAFGEAELASRAAELEVLAAALGIDELVALCETLRGDRDVADAAITCAHLRVMAQ